MAFNIDDEMKLLIADDGVKLIMSFIRHADDLECDEHAILAAATVLLGIAIDGAAAAPVSDHTQVEVLSAVKGLYKKRLEEMGD